MIHSTGNSFSSHDNESPAWEVQVAQEMQVHAPKQQEDANHDDSSAPPTEAQDKAEAIMIQCLGNIVDVYMKAQEYDKAKQAAEQILVRDPHNFGALFQIAKASLLDHSLGSFEEADKAIQAASQAATTEDQMREVQDLQAELARRKHQYKRKAKAMFRRMRKSIRSS